MVTVEVGALVVWGLALTMGAGCDKSSGGDQAPAASASAGPSASAAATPSAAPSGDQATATAPDQAGGGDDYADDDPSAITDFHTVLDSHGSWKEDPKFGTVWVPAPATVGANFVPYQTGGHWVYGDDYTWVSDYDWGWAPFHYGRWTFIDGPGWSWIPGRVYSPAWVTWRTGAPGYGFVGWAPLAPAWGWRSGVVFQYGFPLVPRYSYVAVADVFHVSLASRVLVGARIGAVEVATHPFVEGVAVGGRVAGPAPTAIGCKADAVVHPKPGDPALAKAQGFSKPSTAAAQGGHPPSKGAKTSPTDSKKPADDSKKPADTSGGKDKAPPSTPKGGADTSKGGAKPSGKKDK
jgi:hypothetical protein